MLDDTQYGCERLKVEMERDGRVLVLCPFVLDDTHYDIMNVKGDTCLDNVDTYITKHSHSRFHFHFRFISS